MMSFFTRLQGVVDGLKSTRSDTWVNELTGLGILGRDKVQSHTPGVIYRLSDATLSSLYHGDAIAARLVTKIVEDAMRQGGKIAAPPDKDATDVQRFWDKLGAWKALQEADIWGRLYGSGAVFVGANDGAPLETPLREDGITTIRFLTVLDGSEYTPVSYYNDPLSSKHGEPEIFRIYAYGKSGQSLMVHESRFILFGGEPTARQVRASLQGRDYSVLQRISDALKRFDSDWRSASAMMSDGSQGVLRMKGFADVIAGGGKEVFATRMELINLCRSVARIMPLDADEEDFQYVERSWAGVADLLDKTTVYLSACAGMPVTVLFGRSPSGLNATGESDRIGWYDTVQAHRDYVILPRGQTLLRLVCLALGVDPDGWVLECPALLQESDKDYAARQKIVADTDSVYLAAEVLRPEEVALARYGRGEWSDTAPQIDTESRETMLKIDLERVQSGGEEVGPQRLTPSGEAGVPPTKADPTSPESPDYDPATATATGEQAPPETPAANAAFNGAQTASLVSIVTAVASGNLPASSAIEILLVAFPDHTRTGGAHDRPGGGDDPRGARGTRTRASRIRGRALRARARARARASRRSPRRSPRHEETEAKGTEGTPWSTGLLHPDAPSPLARRSDDCHAGAPSYPRPLASQVGRSGRRPTAGSPSMDGACVWCQRAKATCAGCRDSVFDLEAG